MTKNISNLSAEQAGFASKGPKPTNNTTSFKPSANNLLNDVSVLEESKSHRENGGGQDDGDEVTEEEK